MAQVEKASTTTLMATIKVNVKWGKQKFEVDLDTSAPVELFKAQLFALTQVPPGASRSWASRAAP